MATKSQVTITNHLLEIIKTNGRINKFDLMDKACIGLSTYNQLSGWFKHRFQDVLHVIEYDKKSKEWVWKGVIQVEQ